jgi:hypothetical protein
MIILMLKTVKGSNDGIKVKKFVEGQKYQAPQEISFSLVEVFTKNKYAKSIELENKMIDESDIENIDDVKEDEKPVEHKVFQKSNIIDEDKFEFVQKPVSKAKRPAKKTKKK